MLASARIDCPVPISTKASAKARNNVSCVRRQKRRKNRAQTKNPSATAPERKSYNVTKSRILDFPDETPNEKHDRRKRKQQPDQSQIDIGGPHDEIQDECQIVGSEKAEADAAPQQQPRPVLRIATPEEPRAGNAGR